jgi:spore germination protein GerM
MSAATTRPARMSAANTRSARATAVIVAMLALLASCGIANDTAPRNIPEADRPSLANSANQAAGATSGTDRIYLLAPESPNEAQHLRPTQRDVGSSATRRLESLFGALTVAEVSSRLRTAIPEGLVLHSAVLQADGTLVVDVSDEMLALSAGALIDAVAQIVFTASEVDNVQRIDLLADGKPRQWPAGDGELQRDPLTVYDYPGFIESTQPNFPAIPSPEPDA